MKVKIEILLIYMLLSFYFIAIPILSLPINFTVFNSNMRFSKSNWLASVQSSFCYG